MKTEKGRRVCFRDKGARRLGLSKRLGGAADGSEYEDEDGDDRSSSGWVRFQYRYRHGAWCACGTAKGGRRNLKMAMGTRTRAGKAFGLVWYGVRCAEYTVWRYAEM
jgi:hypothetical protein